MIRILIALIFTSTLAFGQDSSATRNKEFYLSLADFSPLNIHLKYKHQIGQRTYLKFGFVNLSASYSENFPGNPSAFLSKNAMYSGGVEVGIEFRKAFNNRLSLFHGPNLRYTYQRNTNKISTPSLPFQNTLTENHIASIPYSVGLLFSLTPKLLLAAEVNPSVNFSRRQSGFGSGAPDVINSFGFSLDNRFGLLSLVLRI